MIATVMVLQSLEGLSDLEAVDALRLQGDHGGQSRVSPTAPDVTPRLELMLDARTLDGYTQELTYRPTLRS